jgi:hypothetical protein
LGAYFAYQVGIFGPQFGAYAKPLGLYYGVCAFIYFVVFLVCTLLAGGKLGLKYFGQII